MKPFAPLYLAVAPLLIASAAAHADGQLMVMPATTRVTAAHEQTVTVTNLGDAPLYLAFTLKKVMNPGLLPEQKVAIGDLDMPGLIATPDKITLGPNQSRQIALKPLLTPAVETLYRLYVVPVRDMHVQGAPTDRITAPMSMAIGYGVLVRHLPPPNLQTHRWTFHCDGRAMTLENTGTVRVVLSELTYAGEAQPQTVALFPGVVQHFPTERMSVNDGESNQTLTCPKP